ncbi:ANKHD1 [Symbiodinium natans]|uniref:ANKHD1 protein n=1 Tax=Symbiodinium natans TaxID=878477 RepID=A0A812UHA8_9DINO|nr:ANKHD1 [Symbiodinium natans]
MVLAQLGFLTGALTTGKSVAESLGPLVFSFLFEAFNGSGQTAESGQLHSRLPILVAFALSLPLLCIVTALPNKLASYIIQKQAAEQSAILELENLEAEDVSLLDKSQRERLL